MAKEKNRIEEGELEWISFISKFDFDEIWFQ